jgi:hypothetical protein
MPGVKRCVYCRKQRNHETKTNNVSFHIFPLEKKELLQLWLNALSMPNFVPSRYHLLCSDHFNNADFEQSLTNELGLNVPLKRKLKDNAVPISSSGSRVLSTDIEYLAVENLNVNQNQQVCFKKRNYKFNVLFYVLIVNNVFAVNL